MKKLLRNYCSTLFALRNVIFFVTEITEIGLRDQGCPVTIAASSGIIRRN